MPTIDLTTFIAAPAETVFNLSRSISLHQLSMQHTGERAIAGKSTGLLELNETVTWQAKHLFKQRSLQVKMTSVKHFTSFTDEMVTGDFKSMKHEHHFKEVANGTLMIDVFSFEVPYGGLGKFFSKVYLQGYMKNLLEKRNAVIKDYAESNKWKAILY
ncbi:MAG: hypothetical protein JWQ96_3497 [Segetibacter sp.]|nr:hypothetical protein [Segetibacter sp.]